MHTHYLSANYAWLGKKPVMSMNHVRPVIFGRNLTPREQGRISSIKEFEKQHLLEPLFDALISDQSHHVRIAAHKALKRLNLSKYSKQEKQNAENIHKLGIKAIQKYNNGHNLKQAIFDLGNRGCNVLFKNDLLPAKLLSRDLLESYDMDDDDINDIRSGLKQITVGQLLGKAHGEYINPNKTQRECVLFNRIGLTQK